MNDIKATALVPMKGNSERVPNKNIRDLNGKPVCHWILESLSASSLIDEIIVNTDSESIKKSISRFKKIKIIDRPKHLLGDSVSAQPLIEHDLNFAKNEIIFQTHATNPLLKTETIDRAIKLFYEKQGKYDSVFSVTPIKQRYYFKSGKPINHDPDNLIQTQLLDPIYHENSCLYIFQRNLTKKIKIELVPIPYFLKWIILNQLILMNGMIFYGQSF